MTKAGCCRIMTCIPDARLRLIHWLLDREYIDVSTTPYPEEPTGHTLTKSNIKLVMFAKPLQLLPPPPKAVSQSQESYRAAATATFIGQDDHMPVSDEVVENMDHNRDCLPKPPAGKGHLPPHWRGVQSMGREVASDTTDIAVGE